MKSHVRIIDLGAQKAFSDIENSREMRVAYGRMAVIYGNDLYGRWTRLAAGGTDRGRWIPLKKSTIKRKGGDRRILIRSGRQISAVRPGGVGNRLELKKDGFAMGFSNISRGDGITFQRLGNIHTFGASKGKWRVPSRPMFTDPSKDTMDEFEHELFKAVHSIVQKDAKGSRR